VLEPRVDGFRNYYASGETGRAEHLLVNKAQLLSLTAPEMTVLVGGLRVLGANHGGAKPRCVHRLPRDADQRLLHQPPGHGNRVEREASDGTYEGHDRATGELKWTGTRVDLVFGSNSELRALAEVYACDDAKEHFVRDFVAAWDKVMMLDRFELS
jgi:catalase-peroxidase